VRAQQVQKSGTRVAVQFGFDGKRVRAPAPVVAALNPPLNEEPDEQGSAIKQAIVRWLNEK
jgi:hypothetical protein